MEAGAFRLVLASAGLHAAWNIAARKAAGDFGAIWWGLALAGSALAAGAALAGLPLGPAASGWALASGAFNAVYFAALSRAYGTGEVGLVYPVARGAGVGLTALSAALLLGERFSAAGGGGIVMVLLGILSLAATARGSAQAVAAAALCGLCTAGYAVCDKLGSALAHPVPYLGAQYLVAALLLAPRAWAAGEAGGRAVRARPGAVAWIGFGSAAAYLLILLAYRRAPLGYVSAARELSLALGAVGARWLLGEALGPARAGALAVVLAGILLLRLA